MGMEQIIVPTIWGKIPINKGMVMGGLHSIA
jgi:hypothetical protein